MSATRTPRAGNTAKGRRIDAVRTASMGVLDSAHFSGDDATKAELEQGIHEEFAQAMQRRAEAAGKVRGADARWTLSHVRGGTVVGEEARFV